MAALFDKIRALVKDDRYVVGFHASERLEERGILEWQAVTGMLKAKLLEERLNASPNPVVEVLEVLPDGVEFKAVWSLLRQAGVAKLVTVYYLDGN